MHLNLWITKRLFSIKNGAIHVGRGFFMSDRQPGARHRKQLKSLISLSLLEGVSPPLLSRLLQPHVAFLAASGIALGDSPAALARLHRLLGREGVPEELVDALLQIEALADEDNHDDMLAQAGADQLDLFARAKRLSTADLAFTIYLDHRDVFQEAGPTLGAERVTRFVEFCGHDLRPAPALTSKTRRERLVEALQHWFASRHRTGYVEVEIAETPTEFNFHIIHGRPEKRRTVISDDERARTSLSYIPDKHDLLIYDPNTHKLCINAQFAIENNFYRRVIGEVYFGDVEHFQPRSVFTGVPIQEEGTAALSVDGVDGLRSVVLRELTIERPRHATVFFKGDDLSKELQSKHEREVIRSGTIAQMRFALGLAGRTRALRVEVSLPNTLSYDRRIEPDVVRAFLRKRGFRAVATEAA